VFSTTVAHWMGMINNKYISLYVMMMMMMMMMMIIIIIIIIINDKNTI